MGALPRRARPRWLDAGEPYAVIFAVAFLSSLSGFMMGSGISLHTALRNPDMDMLGARRYVQRQRAHGMAHAPCAVRPSAARATRSRMPHSLLSPRPPCPPGAHRAGPSIAAAQADAALRGAALAEARKAVAPEPGDACRTEQHAEYGGEFVVKWGEYHLQVRVGGRGLNRNGERRVSAALTGQGAACAFLAKLQVEPVVRPAAAGRSAAPRPSQHPGAARQTPRLRCSTPLPT
jgi:hypothetical protein